MNDKFSSERASLPLLQQGATKNDFGLSIGRPCLVISLNLNVQIFEMHRFRTEMRAFQVKCAHFIAFQLAFPLKSVKCEHFMVKSAHFSGNA